MARDSIRTGWDLGLLVFVEVMLDKTTPDVFERFASAVQLAPEVLECHMVAGGFDYLVKARVADMTAYRRFLGEDPAGAAGRARDPDLRRHGRGQARRAAAGRMNGSSTEAEARMLASASGWASFLWPLFGAASRS